jgi:hypothetical protein
MASTMIAPSNTNRTSPADCSASMCASPPEFYVCRIAAKSTPMLQRIVLNNI